MFCVMHLKVQKRYFDSINKWNKLYEWRLAKEKYRRLKVWDEITFSPNDSPERVVKKIASLHFFDSFEEAWVNLWIEHILPWIADLESFVGVYREFYSKDEEQFHRIIMIWI